MNSFVLYFKCNLCYQRFFFFVFVKKTKNRSFFISADDGGEYYFIQSDNVFEMNGHAGHLARVRSDVSPCEIVV